MTENKKPTRRRGKQLENELLTAAWDELQDKGYDQLTMEGIAERAKTTKTVIYRRWSKKSAVVVAAYFKAFREHGPKVTFDIPDNGSLREDLIQFLSVPTAFFDFLGEETVRGIISDQIASRMGDLFEHMKSDDINIIKQIQKLLGRATDRGEINSHNLSAQAIRLPLFLLINEVLTTGFLTEAAVVTIVDEILMPVYLNSNKNV